MSNRKEDLAKKNALSKMVQDKDDFLEFLKSQRHGVFMVSTRDLVMLNDVIAMYCRRSLLLTRRGLMKLNSSDWRSVGISAELNVSKNI